MTYITFPAIKVAFMKNSFTNRTEELYLKYLKILAAEKSSSDQLTKEADQVPKGFTEIFDYFGFRDVMYAHQHNLQEFLADYSEGM